MDCITRTSIPGRLWALTGGFCHPQRRCQNNENLYKQNINIVKISKHGPRWLGSG